MSDSDVQILYLLYSFEKFDLVGFDWSIGNCLKFDILFWRKDKKGKSWIKINCQSVASVECRWLLKVVKFVSLKRFVSSKFRDFITKGYANISVTDCRPPEL